MALLKSKWTWFCLLLALGGAGAVAWLERVSIAAWYHAGQLARASESQRGRRLEALASHEQAAVPALLRHLDAKDETARANAEWALIELARLWGPRDGKTRALAACLGEAFSRFSGIGQGHALRVLNEIIGLTDKPAKDLIRLAARLVVEAAEAEDAGSLSGSLPLALAAVTHSERPGDVLLHACRKLALSGLKDARADCRAGAIRLGAAPGVGVLDQVPPLLTDVSAEVRSLAVLAVGGHEDLVSTDDLLPLLHDADREVRTICDQALRSRGLGPAHVQLARAMSDPRPSVRAGVPAQVPDFPELDARVWLERLSRDSSPAVRAAVVRVAAEAVDSRLRDRLREMATNDRDQTVRQIVEFYLRNPHH